MNELLKYLNQIKGDLEHIDRIMFWVIIFSVFAVGLLFGFLLAWALT